MYHRVSNWKLSLLGKYFKYLPISNLSFSSSKAENILVQAWMDLIWLFEVILERTKFEALYLYFRFFLQQPANPDLLYIIFFCHSQLTISILLCLIFASKVSKTLFYFPENRKLSLYRKKYTAMK